MCFALSDCELIFIGDFVKITLVLVLEMLLLSNFARHPRVIIGLGPIFALINYLGNSCVK